MDGRGMEEAGVDDRVVSILDIRDAPSNAHGHHHHTIQHRKKTTTSMLMEMTMRETDRFPVLQL